GTLTFSAGKLDTGANTLSIASAATVSGATGARYVIGNLLRAIASSGTAVTYDTGTSSTYAPATVTLASGGSFPKNVTVKAATGPHASAPNTTDAATVYWTLTSAPVNAS